MLNLPGSNKVIEVIKKIQAKNKEFDSAYVPERFHEPNTSFLRRLIDFVNPWHHPAELKPPDGLKSSLSKPEASLKTSPKHRQTSDIVKA